MKSIFTWMMAVAALSMAYAGATPAETAAAETAAAGTVPADQAGQEAAPADPGAVLFEKRCAQCHSLARGKNGNGPSLHGVINRPAASEPGFKYSRAMRQMATEDSLNWSEEYLAAFVAQPSQLVPGTRMAFAGMENEEDRAALIAWIKANSGPPYNEP